MSGAENRTRIVPAIDLIDGRCVRLRQGDFSSVEIMGDDPVEVAKSFEESGFSRLHLVDLTGAKTGTPEHLAVLESIATATSLRIDYSGGLRNESALEDAFSAGASQIAVGSAAVRERAACTSWLRRFGGDKIIIGLDVLSGRVQVSGWTEATDLTASEVISWYLDAGIRYVMSTDIACDGMLRGPGLGLYEELRATFPDLSILASGGVTTAADVHALAQRGVKEVIVGKALYAASFEISEVRDFVW